MRNLSTKLAGFTSAWRRWLPPTGMILVLWIVGFPALQQYNVTWDEALGDFFFGQRYWSYFTTLDPVYLNFDADVYPAGHSPNLGLSPFRILPWEYYPFANTLAAATSEILSRQLGWLDPFDGFHALNLLLGALMIAVFYPFLQRREGTMAATCAVGLLFSAPRIVCHMMANTKDIPLMLLYTLTAIAFYIAFEAGSVHGLLGAGVLLGATLATKANALFFPAIPAGLLILGGFPEPWRERRVKLLVTLVAGGLLAVAVMVLLWPYLWADPIGRYLKHLNYIVLRKFDTAAENTFPALDAVLLTTPLSFLLLFAVGLVPCVRRGMRRERLPLFLLVWIGVVLGRYLLPQAVNFDGVRHFLELFPAMAAVAGIGAAWISGLAARRTRHPQAIKTLLLLLFLLPGAWQSIRTHPFQIAYWNALAGGPRGAWEHERPQAGDYWGMSYRIGLRWINENAPPDSFLAVPVAEHAVLLVAQTRLRNDIRLLHVVRPGGPWIDPVRLERVRQLAREQPVYVMFVGRREWMNELTEDCLRTQTPVAVWEVEEGAPVLWIYRYQPS